MLNQSVVEGFLSLSNTHHVFGGREQSNYAQVKTAGHRCVARTRRAAALPPLRPPLEPLLTSSRPSFGPAVTLTQVDKKDRGQKTAVVNTIRDAVDEYANIYTFTFDNMRSELFNPVRQEWRDSRFFFGKNKVMQVALGRSEGDAYRENTHLISAELTGNVGMLMTNRSFAEVSEYFGALDAEDYARAGSIASSTVAVAAGPRSDFLFSQFEYLRKLGLPVQLKTGVIVVEVKHTVCREGEQLDTNQAKLLQLLGEKQAKFVVQLESMWSDGKFTKFE